MRRLPAVPFAVGFAFAVSLSGWLVGWLAGPCGKSCRQSTHIRLPAAALTHRRCFGPVTYPALRARSGRFGYWAAGHLGIWTPGASALPLGKRNPLTQMAQSVRS